jgi:hypothetical protein
MLIVQVYLISVSFSVGNRQFGKVQFPGLYALVTQVGAAGILKSSSVGYNQLGKIGL